MRIAWTIRRILAGLFPKKVPHFFVEQLHPGGPWFLLKNTGIVRGDDFLYRIVDGPYESLEQARYIRSKYV